MMHTMELISLFRAFVWYLFRRMVTVKMFKDAKNDSERHFSISNVFSLVWRVEIVHFRHCLSKINKLERQRPLHRSCSVERDRHVIFVLIHGFFMFRLLRRSRPSLQNRQILPFDPCTIT